MGLSVPERIYLDTNIFIAALQGSGDSAGFAREALRLLSTNPIVGATSEITLAEMLVKDNPVTRRMVERLIRGRLVTLYQVTRDILLESATLRRTIRHKLPDAIHIATALGLQCKYILSFDKDMKRLPSHLNLMPAGADGLSILKKVLA